MKNIFELIGQYQEKHDVPGQIIHLCYLFGILKKWGLEDRDAQSLALKCVYSHVSVKIYDDDDYPHPQYTHEQDMKMRADAILGRGDIRAGI